MASRMLKTTVYLEREDLELLERMATEQRQSSALLIRRAIRLLAERETPAASLKSIGCVNSGGRNLSGRADELLGAWARKENSRRLRRRR